MPDHPTEQVDREAVVVQTLRLWGDTCTRENADYLARKVCAALDAATPPLPEGVRWSPEFSSWECSNCGTQGNRLWTASQHQCPLDAVGERDQ